MYSHCRESGDVCCFASCVGYSRVVYTLPSQHKVCIGFQVMFKIEEDVEGIRESVRIGLCAFVLVEHVLWHMHRHMCVNVCTENMQKHACHGIPHQICHGTPEHVATHNPHARAYHLLLSAATAHPARRDMLLHAAAARYCKHLQVDQLQESASAVSRKKSASKERKQVATMYKIQEDRCNS